MLLTRPKAYVIHFSAQGVKPWHLLGSTDLSSDLRRLSPQTTHLNIRLFEIWMQEWNEICKIHPRSE